MSELEPIADPHDASTESGRVRPRFNRWVRAAIVLVAILAVAAVAAGVSNAGFLAVVVAIVTGLVILRVGWFFLQSFATPPPEPPEPGQLRKVKLTYRCPVCGAEVRMTVASTEDPEPPRHCMEDMELVAPVD